MSVMPYSENEIEPARSPAGDLVVWAQQANDVHRVAQILATTQFVPKTLQGRPDDIAATILYGNELNLPPMVALQQINMIEGRPSLTALSMRGMAQAAGVKFRYEEQTETRCRISALAPGDAQWTTVTWTVDQAKKLGLSSKSNWQKQPGAMLIARATSQLCRLVAAPLYLGMSYSTEELKDGNSGVEFSNVEETPFTEAAPAAEQPATRTIRRAPVKATASFDNGPKTEEKKKGYVPSMGSYSTEDVPQRPLGVKVERPNMVSANTRAALMAGFNDAGIKDRVTRLAYVSDLLKREVNTVNDVTEGEAKQILDQLHIDTHQGGEAVAVTEDVAVAEWGDVEVVKVPADD